jgi:hypothetical protein
MNTYQNSLLILRFRNSQLIVEFTTESAKSGALFEVCREICEFSLYSNLLPVTYLANI